MENFEFIGKEYTTNIEVKNTLKETVSFGWRCNKLQEPSLYPVSTTTFQLKSGESKSITIVANSLKTLSNSQLSSVVTFYSYYQLNGEKTKLLINGKRFFSSDLHQDSTDIIVSLRITNQQGTIIIFDG